MRIVRTTVTGPAGEEGGTAAAGAIGTVRDIHPDTLTYWLARGWKVDANDDGVADEAATAGAYQPLVRATTVAYAATVTPNADTTDVLNIGALTGNLTLAAPTGTPRDGQTLMLRLAQDATGARTITYNAAYAFGTDVTAALDPSTASAKWSRLFAWNASDSKWRALAIARGF